MSFLREPRVLCEAILITSDYYTKKDGSRPRLRGERCDELVCELVDQHGFCWVHAKAVKDGTRTLTSVLGTERLRGAS